MKSIIYDVDGTLWDSTALIAENWRKISSSRNYPFEHITADALRGEFGKLLPDIGRSLFPMLPEDEMLKLITDCCDSDNAWLFENRQPLYEGVEEVITAVHNAGLKQIIVSNCTGGYIETLIAIHHLEDRIDGHICATDTGFGKCDNIRIACERYQLDDPVYVGDTLGDYTATKGAGLPFVFASYGFGCVPSPDYIIQKPEDILTLAGIRNN